MNGLSRWKSEKPWVKLVLGICDIVYPIVFLHVKNTCNNLIKNHNPVSGLFLFFLSSFSFFLNRFKFLEISSRSLSF